MQSEQKSPSLLSVYEWIDYWQEGSDQHLVDQFDMQRDGKKELEWAAKAISHLIGTMRDICDVPHESNPDFATAVRYAKNALTEYGVK